MERIRTDWLAVSWLVVVVGAGVVLFAQGGALQALFPGKQGRVVRVAVGRERALSYSYRRRR